MLVFEESLFSSGVEIIKGCFGVVAFEVLFSGPYNLKPGSEHGIFKVLGRECVNCVFDCVKLMKFFTLNKRLANAEFQILT